MVVVENELTTEKIFLVKWRRKCSYQITASNFRIMGILVDLRELCERSREVDVVDRQKLNKNIKIKLIHCFWTYI